jgi:hypothetical protein
MRLFMAVFSAALLLGAFSPVVTATSTGCEWVAMNENFRAAKGTARCWGIRALMVDKQGTLYAGGTFVDTAGDTIRCIARREGSTWVPLGKNLDGYVNAIIFDTSDMLFAGGILTVNGTTATGIAKWNGIAWDTVGSSKTGVVYDLALDTAGNLLAAGDLDFQSGSQHIYKVGKWNGAMWSPVLGTLTINGHVNTIGVTHTALVIGGNFSLGPYCGFSDSIRSIFSLKWNGQVDCYSDHLCQDVDLNGKPLNGDVYKIAISKDMSKIWYAGRFVTINGILHYGFNAPIDPMFSGPGAFARSVGLAVEPVGSDGVFLAGGYTTGTRSTSIQYLGSYFPDFNPLMAVYSTKGSIEHLAYDSIYNRIYLAGRFDTAGKLYSPYLARIDLFKNPPSRIDPHFKKHPVSGQVAAKVIGNRLCISGLPAGTIGVVFYSFRGQLLKASEINSTFDHYLIPFPQVAHNATICRVTAGKLEHVFVVGR